MKNRSSEFIKSSLRKLRQLNSLFDNPFSSSNDVQMEQTNVIHFIFKENCFVK